MKAYLAIIFVLIILLNCFFAWYVPERENFSKGQLEMNLLVGFNSLLAIVLFVIKSKVKDQIHLLYLAAIPMRFIAFLLFFFLIKSMNQIDLKSWIMTYLFAFVIFHLTETGFLILSLKKDEKHS